MNADDFSDAFPDWLTQAIAHLAAVSGEMTPEQIGRRIHEALQICEVDKYATQESQFSFGISGGTDETIAEIRRQLTPFENFLVRIENVDA